MVAGVLGFVVSCGRGNGGGDGHPNAPWAGPCMDESPRALNGCAELDARCTDTFECSYGVYGTVNAVCLPTVSNSSTELCTVDNWDKVSVCVPPLTWQFDSESERADRPCPRPPPGPPPAPHPP
jgi:hypothetical protein